MYDPSKTSDALSQLNLVAGNWQHLAGMVTPAYRQLERAHRRIIELETLLEGRVNQELEQEANEEVSWTLEKGTYTRNDGLTLWKDRLGQWRWKGQNKAGEKQRYGVVPAIPPGDAARAWVEEHVPVDG